MPAFGSGGATDAWMHRRLPKAPGCFNWTSLTKPAYCGYPTPVLRYPTVVIAAWETLSPPDRTAGTRNTGSSMTRGGQQQETEAAGMSALAGSPQPSSSALTCSGRTHAARHGFLRGSRTTPRVASYRYVDDLIWAPCAPLYLLPCPPGLARDSIIRDVLVLPFRMANAPCCIRRTGWMAWAKTLSNSDTRGYDGRDITSSLLSVRPTVVLRTQIMCRHAERQRRPSDTRAPSQDHRIETCIRDSLNMAAPGSPESC